MQLIWKYIAEDFIFCKQPKGELLWKKIVDWCCSVIHYHLNYDGDWWGNFLKKFYYWLILLLPIFHVYDTLFLNFLLTLVTWNDTYVLIVMIYICCSKLTIHKGTTQRVICVVQIESHITQSRTKMLIIKSY